MSVFVIGLVVLAALCHATWQALVKSSPDRYAGLAAINVFSGIVGLVRVPFVAFPDAKLWLILAISVPVHLAYKFALAAMYKDGDLSQAYPFARGMTPLMVALLAYLAVGEVPGLWQLIGMLSITGALVLLACEDGSATIVSPRSLFYASVAGLMVALYTVIDGLGARSAAHWFSFMGWLYLLDALAFIGAVRFIRGPGLWRQIADRRTVSWVSSVVAVLSYGVFLWALHLGAMGTVAALRETSVVFAAIIGVLFLGEPRRASRLFAPLLILAGVISIATS